MDRWVRGLCIVVAATCVLAAGAAAWAGEAILGTATYRERIALPEQAVFEALLEEVGRADAPSTVVARTSIANPGNPPIAFAIAYDPATIEPRGRYVVRSKITLGSRLLFTSDRVIPVLTQGAPREVSVVMRRVGGDTASAKRQAAEPIDAFDPQLPATFTGTLTGDGGQLLGYRLNLWPGQTYALQRTWQAAGDVAVQRRDELGRWSIDPESLELILRGAGEVPLRFAFRNDGTLHPLNGEGRPLSDEPVAVLVREPTFAEFDLHLTLAGEFVYFADAARLTECHTGRSFPVAMEADYLRLEQAYTAARPEAGKPLLVTFEGSLVQRPRIEGEGSESTAIVDRFINVWPGETCERNRADASLINTYWRVVRLGDEPLAPVQGRREPHLLLRTQDRRFSATVGCNQLIGGYETDGAALRFGAVAATMMACPPPLDGLERRLIVALEGVRSFHIAAQTLELRDGAGQPLALLQAVYLR